MIRTMFPLCVIAIIVVACGEDEVPGIDAPPGAIDAPTGDGGGIDAMPSDGGGRADAAMGVDCGGMTCGGGDECCVRGLGGMATCETNGTCMGGVIECDGPEDCGASQDCCLGNSGPGGGTSCTGGTCEREICHSPADCGTPGDMCCALGPIGVCNPTCTVM